MTEQATEDEILLAKRIIGAAERHDVPALTVLLKEGSANVMDPTVQTATSPLHAAIASCGKSEDGKQASEQAIQTVELLLQNGAIWNDLNGEDDTPGCIALKNGQTKLYDMMVAAGVRAELLFAKMAALGLDDNSVEIVEIQQEEDEARDEQPAAKKQKVSSEEAVAKPVEETPAAVLDDVSLDNHAYLKSELRYKGHILMDESDNAVMMDWETEIMQRHAETLATKPGLRTMNVGHGMGIVDTAFLTHSPEMHHIVEAHPQVHEKLRREGWYDMPNVTVHEGRWQDVLPKLVEQGVVLDAIYYDTFAEDYAALKEFFAEYVIQLLAKDGKFGWYNGLGADRQVCYDVYWRVSDGPHKENIGRKFAMLTCETGCRDGSLRSRLRHSLGRHRSTRRPSR